jgi:hypothetical protein
MKKSCSICGNQNLDLVLTLGHQPPSDAFLTKEQLELPEVSYPLDLYYCSSCTLVQLGYDVDPNILFREYVYNTGSNNALKLNFGELVGKLISDFDVTSEDFVVDIGSNDGTLLENFIPHGIKVLGVDPSTVSKIAIDKGIPTMVDFFSEEVARRIVSENGKAKIITATNVFAHVVDLDSFMKGIAALLKEDGVFITENGYIVDMVEGMQYDSIYHEHLRYYSVSSISALFEKYGMEVVSVEQITSHGGSIRVYAAKAGTHSISLDVSRLIENETKDGFNSLARYQKFAEDIIATRFALLDIIISIKKSGKSVVGIGAPAKGNTLLNYCKLDANMVDYLAERSALKIGLYSPGMHIPVIDEQYMLENQPEAALLLSWNLAEELIPKIKKSGYKGLFIVPNPFPKIIE